MAGRVAGMLLRRFLSLTALLEILVLFHGVSLPVKAHDRPRCGGALSGAPQREACVQLAERDRALPRPVEVPPLECKLRAPFRIAVTGLAPGT